MDENGHPSKKNHLDTMQGSLTVSPSLTERWRGDEVKGGGIKVSLTCNWGGLD